MAKKAQAQSQNQKQDLNEQAPTSGTSVSKSGLNTLLKSLKTKIKVELHKEQKDATTIIFNNKVVFLTGKAGTSKTFLACYAALKMLSNLDVHKIIITRSNVDVSEQGLGFLKGGIYDKMQPYLNPILTNLEKLLGDKMMVDKLIQMGIIEISPIQYVRGRNFEDCVVIMDEAQNFTLAEMKALTSRLCKDAKMIFTSDVRQIDLKKVNKSASRAVERLIKLDGVELFELLENHRDPLALLMMEEIEKLEEEDKNNTK
jgi:phosphate starvation-inducible PhoH-like protein